MKNFFTKENFSVLADKELIVAIIAIIFIPMIYAGMFLWAFWDPYDQLEDLPVAIVNEDKAYEFEGEELNLGNEFVDNLKDEPEFNFHFVDKSVGYQGLKDEDYYLLIEIPEDFSKNAATVMDDSPQQLNLIYKPNEGSNFLAAQIGDTALLNIEQALEEKITETYAEAIFDKIEEVAEGLNDASDATNELNDGAHELKDGSETLEDNLITFSGKTVEFHDGVNQAYSGSNDLADGADTLAAGIYELYDNSNKLFDASKDLQQGTNQLASGISEADAGLNEMQNKVPDLIDGTNQVKDGLNQLNEKLPEEMSKEIGNQLNATTEVAFGAIDQKINDVQVDIENELANFGISNINDISNIISQKVIAEVDQLPQIVAKEITGSIKTMIDDIQQADALNSYVMSVLDEDENVSDETKEAINQAFKQQRVEIDYTDIETDIKNSISYIMKQTDYENKIITAVETNINPIEKEISKKQQAVNRKIDEDLKTYKNVADTKIDDATKRLNKEIKLALDGPIGQLQQGLTAINDGQSALLNGVNQLADGTNQLKAGSNELLKGQNSYVANMQKFTNSFAKANDGTQELVDGTNDLTDGLFTLKDGSLQLNDASTQLADGSSELTDGLYTLSDGTNEFNIEMHDAAEEANDIESTSDNNNMIANPVNVKNESINDVPNYGTGFTPYFFSLGLYVGALILTIVYPLTEPSVVPSNGFTWFLRKLLGILTIGAAQAIFAGLILILGLGLEVQSIPRFFIFAIITSIVFMTIIQFLVTCFKDPGRFVAMLILILQLTSSAGTYPLELIPRMLQPLNNFLPMTYSIKGFKAVISSGDYSVMWSNVGMLSIFAIISMLLTLSYFIVMHKRKFGNRTKKEIAKSK